MTKKLMLSDVDLNHGGPCTTMDTLLYSHRYHSLVRVLASSGTVIATGNTLKTG